jgi:transposase
MSSIDQQLFGSDGPGSMLIDTIDSQLSKKRKRDQQCRTKSSRTKSKKKLIKEFWNDDIQKISDSIWRCTTENSIRSTTRNNNWNRFLKKTTENTWFNVTRFDQIEKRNDCLPSQPYSWQSITRLKQQSSIKTDSVKEEKQVQPRVSKKPARVRGKSKPKPPVEKVIKIRLYPTNEEKKKLTEWFNTARWTYNTCLNAIKEEILPRKKDEKLIDALRNYCIKESAITDDIKWVKDTPRFIRDEARADLQKAYNSAFAIAKETGKHFEMKYKSKKALSASIVINSKYYNLAERDPTKPIRVPAINRRRRRSNPSKKVRDPPIYRFLRDIKTGREKLPVKIFYDSRIQWKRLLNEYYFIIPIATGFGIVEKKKITEQDPESQGVPVEVKENISSVIALDPGVRTFMTGYCPDGVVIEWGPNDMSRIDMLRKSTDSLMKRISQKEIRYPKRYRMRKAAARMRRRITYMVNELHWKLIRYLCTSYKVVLLPDFRSSEMVEKKTRKISKKTTRDMYSWSHGKFRERITTKAKSYEGISVIICDECFTTKTCGQCGQLNDIGANKVYFCERCKLKTDRDTNAARNILLRYISVNKPTAALAS